jgi:diaminopimelate epimerase
MKINFWKMHGAGNDFILVDDRFRKFPAADSNWIRHICSRNTGIGSEGLILLQPSKQEDFLMRFFNPDGHEAEMCGNGLRCAARLAHDLKIGGKEMTIRTKAGILTASIKNNGVQVSMPPPTDIRLNFNLQVKHPATSLPASDGATGDQGRGAVRHWRTGSLRNPAKPKTPFLPVPMQNRNRASWRRRVEGKNITCSFINTGVPHVVIETDNLEKIDLPRFGPLLRRHKEFAPEGTNVDYMTITGKNLLEVRTFERGVEAETPACGTGITACAIIAALNNRAKPPVRVKCRHGDVLEVNFETDRHTAKNVTLTGPAVMVYEGEIIT